MPKEKEMSEKCVNLTKELKEMEEKGDGCVPKELIRSVVGCEAKRARIEDGKDFSESMKESWKRVKKVKCDLE